MPMNERISQFRSFKEKIRKLFVNQFLTPYWIQQALVAHTIAGLKGDGGDRVMGAIVSTTMRLSKGKADPALTIKLIREKVLKSSAYNGPI